MGWMGKPIYGKLTPEIKEAAWKDEVYSDFYDIIDNSGWLGYGGYRFSVAELKPDYKPDEPTRRIIIVTLCEYRDGELMFKIMDESVNPFYYDCPMRLLKAVEEYPPCNRWSADWRKGVREYHRVRRESNKLVKELTANKDDRRFVLKGGKVATFCTVPTRRGIAKCYRLVDDPSYYRLNIDRIDVEASRELRAAKPKKAKSKAVKGKAPKARLSIAKKTKKAA